MYTKQPEVILFNNTPNPEKSIGLAVAAWHAESKNFPDSFESFTEAEADKLAKAGIRAFHRTAIEYVNLIFIIKNVSRAFQQQLTRTRHASFSIQSMRVVDKRNFAIEGRYTMPPYLSEENQARFHNKMIAIQDMYSDLLNNGFNVEDARGILPLHVHNDITMNINLNALYHMLGQRFCVNTQWEFRQVALQIKKLVKDNLGVLFSGPMEAPCVNLTYCPMREDYCGTPVWKLDEEKRIDFYRTFTPGTK